MKDWVTTNITADIPIVSKPTVIRDSITAACPHLRDKFDVMDGTGTIFYEDGRDILIRFTQLNLDVP